MLHATNFAADRWSFTLTPSQARPGELQKPVKLVSPALGAAGKEAKGFRCLQN